MGKIIANNVMYCGGDIANPNIAPAYNSTHTYTVGSACIYNGQLYKCNTTISTPEAFTPAHWEAVTIQELLDYDMTDYYTKSQTDSAIAGLINDSSTTSNKTWSSNKIQTAINSKSSWVVKTATLTAGQTSVTVSDSSINSNSMIDVYNDLGVWYTSMTQSGTSVTITFPVQTSNLSIKVRIAN